MCSLQMASGDKGAHPACRAGERQKGGLNPALCSCILPTAPHCLKYPRPLTFLVAKTGEQTFMFAFSPPDGESTNSHLWTTSQTSLIPLAALLLFAAECFVLPEPGAGNYRGNQLRLNKFGSECQQKMREGNFPGGPVAKILHSQSRGPGFSSWSGNQIPQASHPATKDPACCN